MISSFVEDVEGVHYETTPCYVNKASIGSSHMFLSMIQLATLQNMAPEALKPEAILELLQEMNFPPWLSRSDMADERYSSWCVFFPRSMSRRRICWPLHRCVVSFHRVSLDKHGSRRFQLGGSQSDCLYCCLFRISRGCASTLGCGDRPCVTAKVLACDVCGKLVAVTLNHSRVTLVDTHSSDVWIAVLEAPGCSHLALRRSLAVECTGLGGADLRSPILWELTLRAGGCVWPLSCPSGGAASCPAREHVHCRVGVVKGRARISGFALPCANLGRPGLAGRPAIC